MRIILLLLLVKPEAVACVAYTKSDIGFQKRNSAVSCNLWQLGTRYES